MIDFKKAISIAKENLKDLIPDSEDISLEGVLISEDKKLYEVALSYGLRGEDPFEARNSDDINLESGLSRLAKVMRYRRQHKKFLIDLDKGTFRGFKNES